MTSPLLSLPPPLRALIGLNALLTGHNLCIIDQRIACSHFLLQQCCCVRVQHLQRVMVRLVAVGVHAEL